MIYPAPDSPSDTRHADKLEFLKAALERTVPRYGAYELKPATVPMNKVRQLAAIQKGDELTLIWGSTSPDLEQDLLPVRICLRKGLMGYRIALIARERQPEFDKVQNVEMLKKYLIGQGNGWGDVPVLRRAGLNVLTGNYPNLFRMVAANRIDLFPRGVTEVFNEWEANHTELPNLAIEKGLLIHYPSPYYFFVSKQNMALAGRLEEGLRMMLKDGSFDEIFMRYNGESIMKAKFNERRIIRLENPTLSPETPLKEKALWFDPASVKGK
ncbi:substrate-binding periplasmic protein [Chitinimonas sp. PSY-7]|uniref:substrate-binding periplasmic protein n=1 Tax=Chitinimonas sp. PSY-7 TaxID=3459088 RepID=UPI0040400330